MFAGTVTAIVTRPADVGQEALGAGHPTWLSIIALIAASSSPLCSSSSFSAAVAAPVERPGAADRALEGLVHEAGRELRGAPG